MKGVRVELKGRGLGKREERVKDCPKMTVCYTHTPLPLRTQRDIDIIHMLKSP